MKTIILILVIALVTLGGCEKWFTTAVKYEVQCDPPGFEVSYTNRHGDLETRVIKESSWSKDVAVEEEVTELWLFADSDNILSSLNAITGRIYVEGKLEAEDRSEALGMVILLVEL